jgi:transcription elongation factor
MSYQEVKQNIKVLAIFKNGTIFPYVIELHKKPRKIEKVNLSYQEREGSSINYYFAVESQGLVAKISFNNQSMIWRLEEIWVP